MAACLIRQKKFFPSAPAIRRPRRWAIRPKRTRVADCEIRLPGNARPRIRHRDLFIAQAPISAGLVRSSGVTPLSIRAAKALCQNRPEDGGSKHNTEQLVIDQALARRVERIESDQRSRERGGYALRQVEAAKR